MNDKTSCFETPKVFDVTGLQVMSQSSTKGNQSKWFLNNLFIKSCFWYDGYAWPDYLCEIAAYQIGNQLGLDVLPYELCKIKDAAGIQPGCYSHNFLHTDEVCITFARLLGNDCSWQRLKSTSERIQAVTTIVCSKTLIPYHKLLKYLQETFLLDYLILNEDRHLNNLSVIFNIKSQQYRLAPIYDNGLSWD